MRTFGAIFAVLSLAFSASAAAIYPRDGGNGVTTTNLGGIAAVDTTVNGVLNNVNGVHQENHRRQVQKLASEVTQIVPRDGAGYPDLVVGVTNQIVGIAADLDVAVKGTVDVKVVVGILGKIKAVLDVAVKAVLELDLKADTVLCLKGKVQVLAQVAVLVAVLIRVVVVKVVLVVLKVTALANVTAVVDICVAICANVAVIIKVGVALVPGLVVAVVRLIADIKVDLGLKVFAAICGVLHI